MLAKGVTYATRVRRLRAPLAALTQLCRKHLDEFHRHADNLAGDNRQMQRELALDLGREILGLSEAIKNSLLDLAEFSPP